MVNRTLINLVQVNEELWFLFFQLLVVSTNLLKLTDKVAQLLFLTPEVRRYFQFLFIIPTTQRNIALPPAICKIFVTSIIAAQE